jgi:hypothetical protein
MRLENSVRSVSPGNPSNHAEPRNAANAANAEIPTHSLFDAENVS